MKKRIYYQYNNQADKPIYCCECGRKIAENEDTYENRTHSTLCLDCLKLLHKKYV